MNPKIVNKVPSCKLFRFSQEIPLSPRIFPRNLTREEEASTRICWKITRELFRNFGKLFRELCATRTRAREYWNS